MKITSTHIPKNSQKAAPKPQADDFTFSQSGGGITDTFKRAGAEVVESPVRSITTAANMASMVGTLSTYGQGTTNAHFCQGTSVVLGAVQGMAAFGRGIDALSSMGYSRTQLGADPKKQAISALGDLMSAAGQFAIASGVGAPAAVLLVGGNVISSACDYSG